MLVLLRTVPWLGFLLALAGGAGGADYFVTPGGSDAAGGSAAQPWRAIQKGLDALRSPGGTLTVLPGTYGEDLSLRASGTAQGQRHRPMGHAA